MSVDPVDPRVEVAARAAAATLYPTEVDSIIRDDMNGVGPLAFMRECAVVMLTAVDESERPLAAVLAHSLRDACDEMRRLKALVRWPILDAAEDALARYEAARVFPQPQEPK